MPYKAYPGSRLRDTVQGHEILLTIAHHNLDQAWKEWYDEGCDKPPPPPAPVSCPETVNDTAKNVEEVVGVAIGLAIVGGVIGFIIAGPPGAIVGVAIAR